MIYSQGVKLGLDLQGGSSFVVEIDEEKLTEGLLEVHTDWVDEDLAKNLGDEIKKAQNRAIEVIRARIDGMGIAEANIYAEKNKRIVIQLPGIDKETRHAAEDSILEVGFLAFHLVHKDNEELVEELWEKSWAPKGYKIQALALPSGHTRTYYVRVKTDEKMPTADQLRGFHAPPAHDFALMHRDVSGRKAYEPVFIARRRELTGEYLENAWFTQGGFGAALVKIKFGGAGSKKFKMITGNYCPHGKKNPFDRGRRLAIVLDGIVFSAPELRTAIFDGEAQIEGMQSAEEAHHLANVLQAGSLPAPVEIIEKSEVDASLGKDSIDSGIRAVMYGGIAVVVFMLVYYMLSGLVANLALGLDLVLLPLGMVIAAGFLGLLSGGGLGAKSISLPVLTLPGIAGILLTIGIAVDANVLIFERIREELRLGKTLRAAISAGYDRAFVTIIDANITTLITAVILFVAGSGPVRGFAVTLCGGILVSMYTALVVTRMAFELIVDKTNLTKLRMLSIVKATKIDFVGKRGIAAVLSVAVIAVTWVFLVMSYQKDPGQVIGVDFTGGSALTFRVEDDSRKPEVAEIRDTLAEAGVSGAHIQYKKSLDGATVGHLLVRTGVGLVGDKKPAGVIRTTILSAYEAVGLTEGLEIEVGPQVGGELRKTATLAIIFALVGIVLYVSWRFEFGFAIGAIAALAHDVLITIGVYCLFGRQLSLPIIAALLTIVGYSVNDTIVVFDRIREDLRDSDLRRKRSYKEICNLSINQTLSRTLLTSVTTLLAVGMLLVFGGGAINDFALALCIGVVVGTYSSIFVATPVMLLWHGDKKPVKKA